MHCAHMSVSACKLVCEYACMDACSLTHVIVRESLPCVGGGRGRKEGGVLYI